MVQGNTLRCAGALIALLLSGSARAEDSAQIRLVTLASSKKADTFLGLGDDRSSPENFSTSDAPDDATGLVFEIVDASGDAVTGITLEIMSDNSGWFDDTVFSDVSAGETQSMVRDDQLYIANPSGADADFYVEVYAVVPASSPSLSGQDWMTQDLDALRGLTLGQVALPGAHDAGTAAINDRSPTSPDASGAIEAVEVFTTALVANWARAQGASIDQQLRAGVRYFDLRIGIDDDGELRLMHSLFSEPISAVIRAVREFSAAHPEEIIILDFQKLRGKSDSAMDAADLETLVSQIRTLNLVPPTLNGAEGAEIQVNDIIESGSQVVAVVLDGDVDSSFFSSNTEFWSRSTYVDSEWFNTSDNSTLMADLDDAVASDGRDPKKLWVLQAQRTFDFNSSSIGETIQLGGLDTWAAEDAEDIVGRIGGDWSESSLNIVMVDWATSNGVPAATISHNDGRCTAGTYYAGVCLAGLSGVYDYTWEEAAAACTEQHGSTAALASLSQLQTAQAQGYNRCTWSWVSDESSDSEAYRVLPMRTAAEGCMNSEGLHAEAVEKSEQQNGICALPAVF